MKRRRTNAKREKKKPSTYASGNDIAEPEPKRDLTQIRFPHWWKERTFIQRLTENQISIEEQKAAVWYEAARRSTEVQKAWLEGKFLFGDNGWQAFQPCENPTP